MDSCQPLLEASIRSSSYITTEKVKDFEVDEPKSIEHIEVMHGIESTNIYPHRAI